MRRRRQVSISEMKLTCMRMVKTVRWWQIDFFGEICQIDITKQVQDKRAKGVWFVRTSTRRTMSLIDRDSSFERRLIHRDTNRITDSHRSVRKSYHCPEARRRHRNRAALSLDDWSMFVDAVFSVRDCCLSVVVAVGSMTYSAGHGHVSFQKRIDFRTSSMNRWWQTLICSTLSVLHACWVSVGVRTVL